MGREKPNWTEDQKFCIETLAYVFGGIHHLPEIKEFGSGICVNYYGSLATFDFDQLTLLVLTAHRDRVRIEIGHSGPRMIKIMAFKRKADGYFYERHPGLSDLATKINAMLAERSKNEQAD